jgi:recombination protein RecA
MYSAASIRELIEEQLAEKAPGALSVRPKAAHPVLRTGVPGIDEDAGGIPMGGFTEICGSTSSGKTSIVHSILSESTRAGQICAWIDANDGFCPASADAAGVLLEYLLWVRCQPITVQDKKLRKQIRPLEQAFRVADILLNSGGFSLIVIDIAEIEDKYVRKVPLSTWFRFQRFVEGKPVALVFLTQRPYAGNYASMVIEVDAGAAQWTTIEEFGPQHGRLLRELPIKISIQHKRTFNPAERKLPRSVGTIAARMKWG